MQHFRGAVVWMVGKIKCLGSWVRSKVSGVASLTITGVLCTSLTLLMFGREMKALLRSITVGGVWSGFLLGKVWGEPAPCRCCSGPDGDGHLFWECTIPPLVSIGENPEFHEVNIMDDSQWLGCLLWHGWLLRLSGRRGASPWAEAAEEIAGNRSKTCMGAYSAQTVLCWDFAHGFDTVGVASKMTQFSDVFHMVVSLIHFLGSLLLGLVSTFVYLVTVLMVGSGSCGVGSGWC